MTDKLEEVTIATLKELGSIVVEMDDETKAAFNRLAAALEEYNKRSKKHSSNLPDSGGVMLSEITPDGAVSVSNRHYIDLIRECF